MFSLNASAMQNGSNSHDDCLCEGNQGPGWFAFLTVERATCALMAAAGFTQGIGRHSEEKHCPGLSVQWLKVCIMRFFMLVRR